MQPDGNNDSKIVDFPSSDQSGTNVTEFSLNIGSVRINPVSLILIFIGIAILFYSGVTIISGHSNHPNDRPTFSQRYRQEGSITYRDKIISGWFLDEEMQHFIDSDGQRYTFVDSHIRENDTVTGYWRMLN